MVRFTNTYARLFMKRMGTRLNMSTAYHPQTDDQITPSIKCAPFEATVRANVDPPCYGRKVGEKSPISYADKRCKPLEIQVGDRVILKPIEIVEQDVKKLKRRRITLVKVRWNSRQGAEYTCEREDQFRKKYPNLFSELVPSSSAAT
ncbi:putative reverse transcriptase domain-containing protein [Tanacetum coccineum]|uniref:Reverse transcriptase domain-containing protein n=1 Tax=Tanacetum coccineum TaxID=301880 RepID=A0ABQ5I7V1_9ASTR